LSLKISKQGHCNNIDGGGEEVHTVLAAFSKFFARAFSLWLPRVILTDCVLFVTQSVGAVMRSGSRTVDDLQVRKRNNREEEGRSEAKELAILPRFSRLGAHGVLRFYRLRPITQHLGISSPLQLFF
jgi:hypothetical protein